MLHNYPAILEVGKWKASRHFSSDALCVCSDRGTLSHLPHHPDCRDKERVGVRRGKERGGDHK